VGKWFVVNGTIAIGHIFALMERVTIMPKKTKAWLEWRKKYMADKLSRPDELFVQTDKQRERLDEMRKNGIDTRKRVP